MTALVDDKALGRELIGGETSLAVAHYRDRVLGRISLEKVKGRSALDLGCGDGMEAEYLVSRGWKVLALDLVEHPAWPGLEKKWKGRLRFATSNAASLNKKAPGTYDLVFEKDMLHHVPDPAAVLAQMKKKVKKGGLLAVLECNRYNPVFYVHLTLAGGHQHFSRRRLFELMDGAGLDGWTLKLIEARVWPVDIEVVQRVMEKVQNMIEGIPLFRSILCYHLAEWTRLK